MKKKAISLALAGAVIVPSAANAVEVAGKKLEIYGKAHVSVDVSDADKKAGNISGLSVSSNSSRVGVKGQYDMENSSAAIVYQVEQTVNLDESSGNWASRNSFVGIKGGFGTAIVGYHDAPFKSVATKWDMFGDTVGDDRNILGSAADASFNMNVRAKNMIMYGIKLAGVVSLQAMYSSNPNGASGLDNSTDNQMEGIGVFYGGGPLKVAAAIDNYKNLKSNGKMHGARVSGSYSFGPAQVGAIFESISADTADAIDRNAYGINGMFKFGHSMDVRLQVIKAGDYKNVSSSGANAISVGWFMKINKQTKVYAAATRTSNDSNAQYPVAGGGHGDTASTDPGGTPKSLSVGFMHSF
jgi:hypothetical protein